MKRSLPRPLACLLLLLLAGCAQPASPELHRPEAKAPKRILVSSDQASAPPDDLVLTPQGVAALSVLLRTQVFTDAAIGSDGRTPEPVLALQRLWSEPDANRAFAFALKQAPLAGQLFALCGLYHSNPEAFRAALPTYRELVGKIAARHGRWRADTSIPTLVRAIEGGHYPERFQSY